MGGSLSEPATLVDLGRHVRTLYTDEAAAARAGLCLGEWRPKQLLAGCSHVDDALPWSGAICS
eukprot:3214191-Alexandrium_andersonii.AAC.1